MLTNIVAFMPLWFVPGMMGKFWKEIPIVVTAVFAISLIEALFILPAHLAHTPQYQQQRHRPHPAWLGNRPSAALSGVFVEKVFGPFLGFCLRLRTLTTAVCISLLILVLAFVFSGRVGFILMPRIESDQAVASVRIQPETPLAEARAIHDRLYEAGERVVQRHGGAQMAKGARGRLSDGRVNMVFFLSDGDMRPISTRAFTDQWKKETEGLASLEKARFESDAGGPGGGAALSVELSHRDPDVLADASLALAERLAAFPNVSEIDEGFVPGKPQIRLRLRPEGEALGLTSSDLAAQVRDAFQGRRAIRQQRGGNELAVRVQRSEEETHQRPHTLDHMLIRTSNGAPRAAGRCCLADPQPRPGLD